MTYISKEDYLKLKDNLKQRELMVNTIYENDDKVYVEYHNLDLPCFYIRIWKTFNNHIKLVGFISNKHFTEFKYYPEGMLRCKLFQDNCIISYLKNGQISSVHKFPDIDKNLKKLGELIENKSIFQRAKEMFNL